MTERLIIENFAGIKYLDLEIKKINVLIGPQASGKSVCAKLLYLLKKFIWQIIEAIENDLVEEVDTNYLKIFDEYFPEESINEVNFLVRYEFSDIFVEISRRENKKLLNYSTFFNKGFQELHAQFLFLFQKDKNLRGFHEAELEDLQKLVLNMRILVNIQKLKTSIIQAIASKFSPQIIFTQLFIPAGRSFFANLQNNIFTFLSTSNNLDPFLREFGKIYENTKTNHLKSKDFTEEHKEVRDEINMLIEKSLCGKYIHEKGKDFLETNGRRVSITNCSSGQQEMLPLATILTALPFLSSSPFGGHTVYIEEPEAHLFPNAQRNVIELISTVFNYQPKKLQFFITTHSPYVLTSINNLIQAGILYEKADQTNNQEVLAQLQTIVPRFKALHPDQVSAYVLENGSGRSIISEETGLIDAQIIDAVSEELAIEFDSLLDLF